ncbi:MAG: hypothetical protein ACTSR8_21830 [Promethearchaeota archaeon]
MTEIEENKDDKIQDEQDFDFLKDYRNRNIKEWTGERFRLQNASYYSDDLLLEFNRYFKSATSFLKGMPIQKVAQKYNISSSTIKKIANDIISRKSSNDLLRKWIGLRKGIFGLEFAIGEVKIFYSKNKRLPITKKDKIADIISNGIYEGRWDEFGIKSWRDLMIRAFGKEQIESWEKSELQAKLDRAVKELRDFYENLKRLPTVNDKEIKWTFNKFNNGKKCIFRSIGITSWNEMLDHVFGEVNREIEKYTSENNTLEQIQGKLKLFEENNGRLPISSEFRSIDYAVQRGVFADQGVHKWNDLLHLTFGEVNVEKGKFKGKEGLDFAIELLKEFKEKNGRKPYTTDNQMPSIRSAISRGHWIEFGIRKWNDLLRLTFGEVNVEKEKYKGEKGLRIAIKELTEFEKLYKKLPKSGDLEMKSITGMIARKEWEEFGIKTWNNLLDSVFGKNNTFKYLGKNGLDNAIEKLKNYEKENGKIPSSNVMMGIRNAIKKGYWLGSGIKEWNDLLLMVFGKVNLSKNTFRGKEGLTKAIEVIQEFEKNNNKLPATYDKEVRQIVQSIYNKRWIKFNIKNWEDLLLLAFGKEKIREENYQGISQGKYKGKYQGNEGFQIAIKLLKDTQKKLDRLPKIKDEGMSKISDAIRGGNWTEFGIKTWNDLLMKVFGDTNTKSKKYLGNDGLNLAISELQEFKNKNKRMPVLKDKSTNSIIRGIVLAINKGFWLEWDVKTWNDLILIAFEDSNRKSPKYNGLEGLNIAIAELKDFYENNNRMPVCSDKMNDQSINRIINSIRKKLWVDFGVITWNQLLLKAFGKVNLKTSKEISNEERLNISIAELKDFYEKNNRMPVCKDKGMSKILYHINKGALSEFGINKWNDLLRRVFDKINHSN